jgi:hypothetical protein
VHAIEGKLYPQCIVILEMAIAIFTKPSEGLQQTIQLKL